MNRLSLMTSMVTVTLLASVVCAVPQSEIPRPPAAQGETSGESLVIAIGSKTETLQKLLEDSVFPALRAIPAGSEKFQKAERDRERHAKDSNNAEAAGEFYASFAEALTEFDARLGRFLATKRGFHETKDALLRDIDQAVTGLRGQAQAYEAETQKHAAQEQQCAEKLVALAERFKDFLSADEALPIEAEPVVRELAVRQAKAGEKAAVVRQHSQTLAEQEASWVAARNAVLALDADLAERWAHASEDRELVTQIAQHMVLRTQAEKARQLARQLDRQLGTLKQTKVNWGATLAVLQKIPGALALPTTQVDHRVGLRILKQALATKREVAQPSAAGNGTSGTSAAKGE